MHYVESPECFFFVGVVSATTFYNFVLRFCLPFKNNFNLPFENNILPHILCLHLPKYRCPVKIDLMLMEITFRLE